jgi:hypothetical protein
MIMSNTDGNSHLNNLLAGKPPEFQAKVLRFALDSGMKEADPAFRLVQYIGYLSQITESAPEEWKDLFKELQGELNQWTKLTAEQLATFQNQTQTIQLMSETSERLTIALNAQELTWQTHSEALRELIKTLMKLMGEQGEIPSLKEELLSLKQDLRATQASLAQIKINLAENSSLTIEISPHQLTQLRQELMISTNANMARLIKEQQKRQSNGFTQIINNIESAMQTLSASELLGTVFSFLIFVALFSGLGVSAFFWAFPPPLSRDASFTVNKAKEQIEFANVKLQRIEKKIGSDSKPIKKR